MDKAAPAKVIPIPQFPFVSVGADGCCEETNKTPCFPPEGVPSGAFWNAVGSSEAVASSQCRSKAIRSSLGEAPGPALGAAVFGIQPSISLESHKASAF